MKIEGLPDELNNSPLVKEAPDMATLVKTALNAQAMIGNSIRAPSEHASEEERVAFKEKSLRMGLVPRDKFEEYVRPEKAEQYTLTAPPEGADKVTTQTEIDSWKAWAHGQGLSPRQFEAYATKEIEARLANATAQAERFAKVNEVVARKYGAGGLEAAKTRALAAAEKFGGKELVDKLAAEPDAAVIVALAEVGKLFQERGMGDLTPQVHFMETPNEAALRLAEITNNKEHAYNKDSFTVGRAAKEAALAEVMRLRRIVEGLQPLPPGKDYMFEEVG